MTFLQRINYYDSMGGSGKGVTESLLMWLEDEDEDKNGDNATFEPDDWTRVGTNRAATPQQVGVCLLPGLGWRPMSACCCCCSSANR